MWARRLAVGLVVGAALVLWAGWMAPQPLGRLQAGPPPVTVPLTATADPAMRPLGLPALPDTYSLQATITHNPADADALVHVRLGTMQPLTVTVSPLGYASLSGARPFAPWPHVSGTENEIGVDVVDGSAVAVRLNRELYWQGAVPVDDGLFVGGRMFGLPGTAEIRTALFYADDDD